MIPNLLSAIFPNLDDQKKRVGVPVGNTGVFPVAQPFVGSPQYDATSPLGASVPSAGAGMAGDVPPASQPVTTTGADGSTLGTKIYPRGPLPLPQQGTAQSADDTLAPFVPTPVGNLELPTTAPRDAADVSGFYPRRVEAETDPEVRLERLQTEGASKEHSLWKRLLSGSLRGLSTGMVGGGLGGGIGGALAGGLLEGFNPQINRGVQTEIETAKANEQVNAKNARIKADQERRMRDAQITDITAKPEDRDLERNRKELKDALDAEYKDNVLAFGKDKATDVRNNREQIIKLKARGLDQGDVRIKQLERRIDEIVRHDKVGEGQAKTNEIGRNERAGATITATGKRDEIKSTAEASKTLAALRMMAPGKDEDVEAFNARKDAAITTLLNAHPDLK